MIYRNQDLIWLIRLVDSSPSLPPPPHFFLFGIFCFFKREKEGGGGFCEEKRDLKDAIPVNAKISQLMIFQKFPLRGLNTPQAPARLEGILWGNGGRAQKKSSKAVEPSKAELLVQVPARPEV